MIKMKEELLEEANLQITVKKNRTAEKKKIISMIKAVRAIMNVKNHTPKKRKIAVTNYERGKREVCQTKSEIHHQNAGIDLQLTKVSRTGVIPEKK